MRFEYAEDDTNTPYFLIPYVWGVVHSMSGVRWNESAVALFAEGAAPDEPGDDGGGRRGCVLIHALERVRTRLSWEE